MEKIIKNILVPINFSHSSDRAIRTGVAMCKRHGAALHLLKVKGVNNFAYPSGKNALLIGLRLESIMDELNSMESYTKDIANKYEINCFYHIKEGAFSKTVAEAAEDFYCDLIVLEKQPDNPILGSLGSRNACEVIGHAKCPVMTVPGNSFNENFKSILLPVGANKSLLNSLEISLPIIKKNHSKVVLFGSIKIPDNNKEFKMVKKMVVSVDALTSLTNENVEGELGDSPGTAKNILKKAIEMQSDLIIISANVKSGLKSFFTPSYTEKIIKNSPVPVLSIK